MVRHGQRGLTLVELIVSMGVLLIAMAVALTLYDATWQSFKRGQLAAQQQQSVRIALDKIGVELQMAGCNHNPDGAPRPDEQIEAAYDTAVVFRADLDGRDPARATTPETTLAGDAFDTVSTGNDEIVLYVLAKPDGSSPDTLVFEADVEEEQRDGDVETVSVPNVALVHDAPPYTLYRVTFSNDPTEWGTPDFIRREELSENIGSLRVRYFDVAGNQINDTFDLTSTADDIGGAESRANDRSGIRRIELELTGLAPHTDSSWADPSDPDPATWNYRKFTLASHIRPRNLGLIGSPDVGAGDGGDDD